MFCFISHKLILQFFSQMRELHQFADFEQQHSVEINTLKQKALRLLTITDKAFCFKCFCRV